MAGSGNNSGKAGSVFDIPGFEYYTVRTWIMQNKDLSPQQKQVMAVIDSFPDGLRFTQEQIAELLGTHKPRINKAMNKLKDMGLVEVRTGKTKQRLYFSVERLREKQDGKQGKPPPLTDDEAAKLYFNN